MLKEKNITILSLIPLLFFLFVFSGCGDFDCEKSGHKFVWKVFKTDYPADSEEVCAVCGTLSGQIRKTIIGDTGYAGGIIFYIAEEEFILTDTEDTARYLEAAPANAGWMEWSIEMYVVATERDIGTGRDNTKKMIASVSDDETKLNNAAMACAAYSYNGINDWFLPSIDELNALYESQVIPDTTPFWSSTQDGTGNALAQLFNDGSFTSYEKRTRNYVRAIRAF
ncbi:MAG: DUF1566 domain-containing protein [Treponema sp.]|nr:DUF1566 domain-containing protein [Treponema sp.]